ncbi:methyl-accepting chemotaxis protein [Enterobacter hormaechei subsp. steigerwaltii]|uniref:methyl-accepting chemotaxis protein n=1 Tax=Enterobacter hormaechei TaxID=158836 RepID=UPI0021627742|nr:methyl-accepting chemotaxis protein [Enterobacter hormaechei]MCS0509843.1 methyl-accepting chemotaxis protein [Enterobacter hormaechei]
MGLVVANSRDAGIIGSSGSSLFQKEWDDTLSTIKGGKATITLSSGYIQTFSPIALGRTEKTWSVLIRVPSEVVMAEAKRLDDSLVSQSRLTITMQIIVGVVVLIASLILLWIFTGKMVKPLRRASAYANKVAEGDFSEHLEIDQDDEVGVMIDSLNSMVGKLSSVLADIKSSAVKVGSGSSELAKSSQMLSQGAANQASSIEQISASMEEMTSNIKQNAENAQTTEKIAMKSAQDAEDGGNAVNKGVEAMKLIASKTLIIEEIARSTNMLALNASIEAARAGEYGKGFAVVASEVGKLAERSQKEASEISKLSADSVTIAEQAGQTIQRIIPDIKKTAELVQEISAASSEQNSGAEQINRAIMQLDQVVQQNASTAEETAGTAEQLSGQAEQMNTAISFFNLSNDESPKQSPTTRAPTAAAERRTTVRQPSKKESSRINLMLDDEQQKSARDDPDNDYTEL